MSNLFLYFGGIVFIIDMLFISVKNYDKEYVMPAIFTWAEFFFYLITKFSFFISLFELVWIIYGTTTLYSFYFWTILFLNIIGIYTSLKQQESKFLFWLNNLIKTCIVLLVFYLNYTNN